MKLLVTGGAGFIGSNFIRLALRERRDWQIVNFDALTYSGTFVMENSIKHNVRGLGMSPVAAATVQTSERLRLQLSYARRRLRTALRHGILVAAWCRARCTLRGRLTLPAAAARRYGFRGKRTVTVASGRSRRAVKGRGLIRLRFGPVAQRRLRNARALGLRLTVTGREVAGGRTTRLSRVVNLLR